MTRLEHADWDRLNRFCLSLHSEQTPAYFFRHCVEALPRLLGIHWAAWQWMDENFQFVDHTVTADFEAGVEVHAEAMMRTMDSHPLVQHVHGVMGGVCTGATLAMTDFLSLSRIRDRAIHAEAYRHLGVHDQVYTEFQFTNRVRAGMTLNAEKSFGPEQRVMMDLVKPHLALAYRRLLIAHPDLGPANLRAPATVDPELPPRLEQTLGHLLNGLPRKRIADEMGLSIHTVNDYVRELYSRLSVHSHAELMARFARR